MTGNAELVFVNLRVGLRNATTIKDLAQWAGLSRRATEAAIQSLRLDGHPICSAGDGIYLAVNAAELRASYESLRSRALNQLVTVRALRVALRKMESESQPTLWAVA